MTRRRAITCFCAALLAIAFLSPTSAQLEEVDTDDLRLVYFRGGQSYLAPHAARCFENSMRFHQELWHYTPWQPVTVFLADFSDRGNASALSVPRNFLLLQTAPLGFDYETVSANERMNWLMNHELVHIAAVDNAAGSDVFFRKVFTGKVAPIAESPESILYFYLTAPRDSAPRWYHEGIAVFVETWMAGGRGRAQGVWDEMVFRSKVRDGSHFYDPLGLVAEGTKVDFQVEVNAYLYGTRFLSYLAKQYSPQSLVEWVARNKGTRKYYAAQFKTVFGKPIHEAWAEWIEWEAEFQNRNLEAIRQYPVTPHQDLAERALGSVSRAQYDPDTGMLYAGFHYPGRVAHIGSIDTADGTVERLVDIKGPVIYAVTSLAYDRESKTLFYTTDNLERRDLNALDTETNKVTALLEDVRIGDLAYNPADRSIWGVRHYNAIATLVRIPHPYEMWERVYSWPYGDVMYGLDVSDDGKHISASVGEVTGRHSLRVWETAALLERAELPNEQAQPPTPPPVAELDFGNTIPSDFTFSPDGRYLYGSSYYTGVSNIFRYDFREDRFEALSNTETGLFRPIPLDDGRVIVFRYTGEGFVPATIEAEPLQDVSAITLLGQQIIEEYPVLQQWGVGSPAKIDLDEQITYRGEYHGFKKLGLESVYPILQGYKDYGAIGARLNFSDPMLLNRLTLTATYTPNSSLPSNERAHVEVDYRRYNWWVNASLNRADFYDLFGPTKASRKGQFYSGGWDKVLLFDEPRKMELNLFANHSMDIDTLPMYQNIPSPTDSVSALGARLGYTNVRSSLGHVEDEKGHRWELLNVNKFVEGETIPTLTGNFDKGWALPLSHSSIWLLGSAGFAVGDIDNAFANLYFGGFGNNYVDHLSIKRFREFYSFPGVEINEISGRSFTRLMLEWDIPPVRFRNAGTPGWYLTWMRPSLFVSGLATNVDQPDLRTEFGNAGAQLDFKFTALSRLPMTLSLGYAVAFHPVFGTDTEAMISLNVMH